MILQIFVKLVVGDRQLSDKGEQFIHGTEFYSKMVNFR